MKTPALALTQTGHDFPEDQMSLSEGYVVLKGHVADFRRATGSKPHFQIRVHDDSTDYRISVNVRSKDGSQVWFAMKSGYKPVNEDALLLLDSGRHPVASKPGGTALDFIRGNLLPPTEFRPLPIDQVGPDNDLNEKLEHYVQRAMADEHARVYAWGEPWGPEGNKKDAYFGFLPGNGVHQIHMNQGNPPGQFAAENGVWQDGGLMFHFAEENLWVLLLLKFQTQAWHTHDQTGNQLPNPGGDQPGVDPDPGQPIDGELPTEQLPDGLARIVAALVNGVTTPEQETVTILNASNRDLDLTGWTLADRDKNKFALGGTLVAGEALRVLVQKPFQLPNKGGIITLLNSDGLKVDGVSYTKAQAANPGWTIVF